MNYISLWILLSQVVFLACRIFTLDSTTTVQIWIRRKSLPNSIHLSIHIQVTNNCILVGWFNLWLCDNHCNFQPFAVNCFCPNDRLKILLVLSLKCSFCCNLVATTDDIWVLHEIFLWQEKFQNLDTNPFPSS